MSNQRDKQALMRTDLIDLLAIERSLRMLKEDMQESVILSAYLRATMKAELKLLKKLNNHKVLWTPNKFHQNHPQMIFLGRNLRNPK